MIKNHQFEGGREQDFINTVLYTFFATSRDQEAGGTSVEIFVTCLTRPTPLKPVL
jgi:hypothetical protein